jgi:lipoprotein-anchoring transpeptidase ErfK/SrfK
MQKQEISRRDFLKSSTLVSLGFISLHSKQVFKNGGENDNLIGRVLFNYSSSFKQPDSKSEKYRIFKFNDLLNLKDPILISSRAGHQEVWYRLNAGDFIPTTSLQIVHKTLNKPVENINRNGQLAEITVPFTTAWAGGATKKKGDQTFFFGSTHWIYMLAEDHEGKRFYRIIEDRWNDTYYIEAAHMRVIPENDLTPLRAEVPLEEKSIRINLKEQIAIAYEGSEPVYLTSISSGLLTGDIDLTTPPGQFEINYKRPSRHMEHSDKFGVNDNALYGVPWVSYFTDTGIAFHGTYWHNDFSAPRSHGCINLPIESARWIYLWTHPVVPPREKKYVSNTGTVVEVT